MWLPASRKRVHSRLCRLAACRQRRLTNTIRRVHRHGVCRPARQVRSRQVSHCLDARLFHQVHTHGASGWISRCVFPAREQGFQGCPNSTSHPVGPESDDRNPKGPFERLPGSADTWCRRTHRPQNRVAGQLSCLIPFRNNRVKIRLREDVLVLSQRFFPRSASNLYSLYRHVPDMSPPDDRLCRHACIRTHQHAKSLVR